MRIPYYHPDELLIRECTEGHTYCVVISNGGSVDFRNGNVDTQLPDRGKMKQFFTWRIVSGLNESSDIGTAGCDHPIERSRDTLKRLQLLQAVHSRPARLSYRLFHL